MSWGAFGFLIVCVSFDLLGFLRFCASWGSFTSILRVLLTWGVVLGGLPWCKGVPSFLIGGGPSSALPDCGVEDATGDG